MYDQKAPLSLVKSIYSDFEPHVQRLFDLADPNGFRIWKLVDTEDLPSWNSNCTALLGDAAHPVEPFGFSGAGMALEDAVTLSALFGPEVVSGKHEEVKNRLEVYHRVRQPRVTRVRDVSRRVGGGQNSDMSDYMNFLQDHDAVSHAREAMAVAS